MSRDLHSLESERALLGALMLDPERFDEVSVLVTGDSFYRPDHGRLFGLLLSMYQGGAQIDRVTVGERVLSHRLGEEAFGGYGYVLSLPEAVPARVNASHYARTVSRLGRLRTVRAGMVKALADLDSGEIGDPAELHGALTVLADESVTTSSEASWATWAETHEAAVRAIDDVQQGRAGRRDVPMPWSSVAGKIPALRPGQLGIVAARPAMGKSAFALQLAECACALHDGVAAGIFSLEMPPEHIAYRSIAGATGVPMRELRSGALDQAAWNAIEDARACWGLSAYINRRSSLTVEDVVAETMSLKRHTARAGQDLRVVVVDYIGLVMASKAVRGQSPVHQIAHVTRALKQLALGASVCVVALSQLNRKLEERPDKRPKMSDLRDSGAIEQDADWIVGLYREWVYDREASVTAAEAVVLKNRDGETGTCAFRFDPPRMRFHDGDENDFVLEGVA